jgi:lipopolysaccharide export system ATP-binding protein
MILEVKNLTLKIKGNTILDNISFGIEKAAITGLLGANGAGKTTTFRALIGEYKITKGQILLNGEDITNLAMYKRAKKGIGYLSQESSVFKELTVEQNLLTYLELYKYTKKEKEAIVDQKLDELNILHLKKKKTFNLSGGERRRVEISRALICSPKILFLDEPFANIDPKTIEDVKKLIEFLKQKEIATFITDHNAYELLSFIDKGLFLHEGKLMVSGTGNFLADNSYLKEHYLGKSFCLKTH